jgi:hypothetical protein
LNAIFATAYLSLTSWAVANWCRWLPNWRLSRLAWTIASLANLGHVLLAFHLLHNWDHWAASAAIAQQTYEQVGWYWDGGIYINYAFCSLWLIDTATWWSAPMAYLKRSRWLEAAVQFVILFMFVNATVIFGKSPFRAMGGVLCLLGALGAFQGARHSSGDSSASVEA